MNLALSILILLACVLAVLAATGHLIPLNQ